MVDPVVGVRSATTRRRNDPFGDQEAYEAGCHPSVRHLSQQLSHLHDASLFDTFTVEM
jgi:hypothetical protein